MIFNYSALPGQTVNGPMTTTVDHIFTEDTNVLLTERKLTVTPCNGQTPITGPPLPKQRKKPPSTGGLLSLCKDHPKHGCLSQYLQDKISPFLTYCSLVGISPHQARFAHDNDTYSFRVCLTKSSLYKPRSPTYLQHSF